MALPQGINLRLTSGYVTDVANDYGEIASSANFPTTTPQGNNVGWESGSSINARYDRNSANDPRLAGVVYMGSWVEHNYRIDLPAAGDYKIRCALGDPSTSYNVSLQIVDNTTVKRTVVSPVYTGAAGRFYDASGVERTSAADWVANNAEITETFASTILRFRIPMSGDLKTAAHFYVESASAPAAELAADATAQATATGALTTGISVESITQTTFGTDATSHAVAMPATVNAGDGLVAIITFDGSPTVTTPQGWYRLYLEANGTALTGAAYARVATGSEGGTTVDFVTSVAETAAAQVYRISNFSGSLAGIIAGAVGEITTGTTADPPSLSTPWHAAETLWLATCHTSTTQTVSSGPTNYTNLTQTTSGSGTTHAQCITARRNNLVETEDPGVFTLSGSGSSKVYNTIAIAPAATGMAYEHYEITNGTTLYTGMFTSQPVGVADADITRAVIVLHGSGLDAPQYANTVYKNLRDDLADAIVITPFFANSQMAETDQLYWGSSWPELGLSDASLAWRISSGGVLDDLISNLYTTFANLEGVVIAGHSAGGQLANRYSAASTDTRNRYLVSAPSSYLYPGAERSDGLGGWDTPVSPVDYDDYKYGVQFLASISYVNAIGATALIARLETAKVTYMVGADDNNPADSSMDLSAPAALQGDTRVSRQSLYYDYLVYFYGSAPSHTIIPPLTGVAHEINGVLASADAKTVYLQEFSDAELAADATAQATATGSLTTQIPVSSASVVVATATGAISTSINLAASVAGVSSAFGDLSTAINMAGAAAAESAVTATLTTGIPLAADAAGQSTATAELQSDTPELAANASGQSTATADLTTTITLSGAAIAQALATAAIDTSILLAGGASAQSDASADISTGIPLEANAAGQATATGGLTIQIQLSADAVAHALATASLDGAPVSMLTDAVGESTATGSLTTQIPVHADASAFVSGSGDLNTQIALSAVAVSVSTATGSLDVDLSLSSDATAIVLSGADLTTQIRLSADAIINALSSADLSTLIATVRAPSGSGYAPGRVISARPSTSHRTRVH